MSASSGRSEGICTGRCEGLGLVTRIVSHSHRVIALAMEHGWLPGARYTNLRDVRRIERLGFLDIDWKHYSFDQHLEAARATRPGMTVARDIERLEDLNRTIDEAYQLSEYAEIVIVVPKDPAFADRLDDLVPPQFRLGYSVPTRYGGTPIPPSSFLRPVHLLGGRPDVQRSLARELKIASVDGNRFTLDASFGDYFDGNIFRKHPVGGYERCLRESLHNINKLWESYCRCWEVDEI